MDVLQVSTDTSVRIRSFLIRHELCVPEATGKLSCFKSLFLPADITGLDRVIRIRGEVTLVYLISIEAFEPVLLSVTVDSIRVNEGTTTTIFILGSVSKLSIFRADEALVT